MGIATKESATQVEEAPGFEGHYSEVDGYTVGFEQYTEDSDMAPLFVGLPGDRCQCPHWGYVIKGKLAYRYDDGTEDVITTGQAYYARPGHTPVIYAGTEIVEFSPSESLAETIAVVVKNLEQMA